MIAVAESFHELRDALRAEKQAPNRRATQIPTNPLQIIPFALARCLHRARQGSGCVAQVRTILSDVANPHGVAATL
eukprot:862538-Heterocapsa_arctica.AAC.1